MVLQTMPGPPTAAAVLAGTKKALASGRFTPSIHFGQRLAERDVDMNDVHNAIDRSHKAVPYLNGTPRNGGTCWRIWGPDCDGDRTIGVGIEIYTASGGYWFTLCTVIEE